MQILSRSGASLWKSFEVSPAVEEEGGRCRNKRRVDLGKVFWGKLICLRFEFIERHARVIF